MSNGFAILNDPLPYTINARWSNIGGKFLWYHSIGNLKMYKIACVRYLTYPKNAHFHFGVGERLHTWIG
jgi:hypothetical protein